MTRTRVVAIGVFRDRGRILVFEGRDRIAGETFYRPLGGGVEFGEYAADAVVRETGYEKSPVMEWPLWVRDDFSYPAARSSAPR